MSETPHMQPVAIQQLIHQAVNELRQQGTAGTPDPLLFLGNPHDTVPRRLLLDPILSPRDKFAWQIIRLYASEQGGTAFPRYNELQGYLSDHTNTRASRSTVSRCLLMLRITRWLSLCHLARDARSGKILGNIYILHDEPLSPDDAQLLDKGYLALLAQCSSHPHLAVREAARIVQQPLRQDTGHHSLLSRIAKLEELARARRSSSRRGAKKSKPQPVPPAQQTPESPIPALSPLTLSWPPHFSVAQQRQALLAMQGIPEPLCQSVLNEVRDKIARGGIRNPFAYLLATLKKAREGTFNAWR